MATFNKKYLVDGEGQRIAVLLDIEEYQKMLDELEELESIRQSDAAKTALDEAIPFDQAIREIADSRK